MKYPYYRLTAWCSLHFAQLWYNHMKSFEDCKGVFITQKPVEGGYEYAVWVIGEEEAEHPNNEPVFGEIIASHNGADYACISCL